MFSRQANKPKVSVEQAGHDISYAIIGTPIVIVGLSFVFAAMIAGLRAISRSFAYGAGGLIVGMLVGGLIFAVGNYFMKRIVQDGVKYPAFIVSFFGALIGTAIIYPGYAANVEMLY